MAFALGLAGCSVDASGADHLTLEEPLTCDRPGTERVADVVDDACGCLAPALADVVVASCIRGGESKKAALTEQFRSDCAERLRSCEASLDAFRACSAAAEATMASECRVPFLAECFELATAPGCALFVGCPEGQRAATRQGVTSCKADGAQGEE